MKFNEIGSQFNLLNATLQQELNEQLQSFVVETHDQQQIIHYVILESGTYSNENNVYKRIKGNPPILSPYAMWKIQLRHTNAATFQKLTKFANHSIDLELVGKGQYLDRKDQVCNSNLEKYYEVADIE